MEGKEVRYEAPGPSSLEKFMEQFDINQYIFDADVHDFDVAPAPDRRPQAKVEHLQYLVKAAGYPVVGVVEATIENPNIQLHGEEDKEELVMRAHGAFLDEYPQFSEYDWLPGRVELKEIG